MLKITFSEALEIIQKARPAPPTGTGERFLYDCGVQCGFSEAESALMLEWQKSIAVMDAQGEAEAPTGRVLWTRTTRT